MAKKKRRGAPPKENPATVRVEFRATPDQRDSWVVAATGMAKKKRRGAPPKENPATVRVEFRATPDQRDSWVVAAKRAGMTLSAWLKALADKAVGQ